MKILRFQTRRCLDTSLVFIQNGQAGARADRRYARKIGCARIGRTLVLLALIASEILSK